jgi:release factor glutamine methyltransferase
MADEGYAGVGRFFAGIGARLQPGGRVLLFFGTSGDQDYVLGLARDAGLEATTVESRELVKDDATIVYSAFRLTPT